MSIPVFSVHGLIAWLETQDPETEYDFGLTETCLATRYFKQFGVELEGTFEYGPINVSRDSIWSKIVQGRPWTYGAALARAKELVTS